MRTQPGKYLLFVLIAGFGVAADILLLKYFNTTLWPYLWPRPALFILLGAFMIAFWFPRVLSGAWALRIVGLFMVFIGQCYLLHSVQVTVDHFSLVAVVHLAGIAGTFLIMVISYINQMSPRYPQEPPLPDDLPCVVAVVPTYGEPYPIVEKTVLALRDLDYPADRLMILVSDDGQRDEICEMAQRYGLHYQQGPRKDAKAGNLNAALAYIHEHFPQATLILTQDADETIAPSFLKKTVGYFTDPQIGFVQTPKEAWTPPGDPFGNRDRVFYDRIQPGRNGRGAAFACGSGVIWRIEAVQSIGGFATWNLVEDLTTSYFLHSAGWRSEYHNEVLSIGLSPDDIPGLLKQRGTWAADTWRLFLFDNPLRKPGLTSAQRLQYLELGLFYVTSSLFMPLLILVPLLSLATGQFLPIEGSALFPWLLASIAYYLVLSKGYIPFFVRMWQYWVGHSPTYIKAFWIAVRSRHNKPVYRVTRKTRQDGFYGYLIWPQFLYLLIGAVLIVKAAFFMPDANFGARLTNIGILGFFMFMVSGICRASLYGIHLPRVRVPSLSTALYRMTRSGEDIAQEVAAKVADGS